MTDEAIIELYFARNEDAIKSSDEKYGRYCLTIANGILTNHFDSEECVNDTWLRAWNSIPPERPCYLKLFFARITRNLAINRYRASNAQKRGGGEIEAVLEELSECFGTDTETAFDMRMLSASVNEFLETLEIRERAIFLRRYFFSEDTQTIAVKFGIKRSNVHKILSRTRKKLREQLTKEGWSSYEKS